MAVFNDSIEDINASILCEKYYVEELNYLRLCTIKAYLDLKLKVIA